MSHLHCDTADGQMCNMTKIRTRNVLQGTDFNVTHITLTSTSNTLLSQSSCPKYFISLFCGDDDGDGADDDGDGADDDGGNDDDDYDVDGDDDDNGNEDDNGDGDDDGGDDDVIMMMMMVVMVRMVMVVMIMKMMVI